METNVIIGIVFGSLLIVSAIIVKIKDVRDRKKEDKKNKRF